MSPDEYLADRLDVKSDWYNRKSVTARAVFRGLRGVEIVLAASIPVLIALSEPAPIGVVAVLGGAIVATSALLHLSQSHERWIVFRRAYASLQREKYTYLTKSGLYSGTQAFELLVVRAEAVMADEHSAWSSSATMSRVPSSLAEDARAADPPV